jgi:hypothetical protein
VCDKEQKGIFCSLRFGTSARDALRTESISLSVLTFKKNRHRARGDDAFERERKLPCVNVYMNYAYNIRLQKNLTGCDKAGVFI